MSASRPFRRALQRSAWATAAALTAALALPAATASAHDRAQQHVLLISVDGMHQADLARYAADHPHSALAGLMRRGESFTHAQTPVPSDSFPGMVGQVTGGNPKTTGIYYDVSYDHALLPAGTTDCSGSPALGAPVNDDESADLDSSRLDAGQGLTGLPGSILQMTGTPISLLNAASFPVDPASCKPVLPHQQLRVNTVFEVARQHGLRTAWSDKSSFAPGGAARSGLEIDCAVSPLAYGGFISPLARGVRHLAGPIRHRDPGPVHARDQQRHRQRDRLDGR